MENLDLKNVGASSAPCQYETNPGQFEEGRDDMLHVFGDDALNHSITGDARPEKKLQAQMLAEMMAIDRPRALTTMEAWAKFVQLASRTRAAPFETLAEYLPSRTIDAGELYVSFRAALAAVLPPSAY